MPSVGTPGGHVPRIQRQGVPLGTSARVDRGGAMSPHALPRGVARRRSGRTRLEQRGRSSRRLLRVVTRQHGRDDAARVAGRTTSPVSKCLQHPAHGALSTCEHRSTTHAQPWSQPRQSLPHGPEKMARLLARRRHQRASLPPEHAKPCTPGQGFGLAQPWTTRVRILQDMLRPLPPIPDSRQRYGLDQARAEHTARHPRHDRGLPWPRSVAIIAGSRGTPCVS